MSPIIEVAIGMIFVFSLLSILVTQINSLIMNLLNLRAAQLKEGLTDLVVDKELQAKVLAHPLIRMVEASVRPSDSLTPDQANDIITSKPRNVTYIEPSTFVEALVSLLATGGGNAFFDLIEQGIEALPDDDQKYKLRELLRDVQGFGNTDTREIREAILAIPDENHKQILVYALDEAEKDLGRAASSSGDMIPLLQGIRQIKDRAFQDALKTILITAKSLNEARSKLESWFNDGMSRATELYKRKLQIISLVVGFILALILNADSIQLLRAFWEDPILRESVAATARANAAQTQAEAGAAGQGQVNPNAPTGEISDDLERTLQQLLDLQLPIGWEFTPITPEMIAAAESAGLSNPQGNLRNAWNLIPGNSPDWAGNLLRKLVGIVVTMIAVAQGAPFWFDLLRRITGGNSSSQAAPVVNVTTAPQPAPIVNVTTTIPEPQAVVTRFGADILMPDDEV